MTEQSGRSPDFSFKLIRFETQQQIIQDQFNDDSHISQCSLSIIDPIEHKKSIFGNISPIPSSDEEEFVSHNNQSYFTTQNPVLEQSFVMQDRSFQSQFLPKLHEDVIADLSHHKYKKKVLLKGCSCKKRGCQQQYCSCYKSGKVCGELCACTQCKNNNEDSHVRKSSTSMERKACKCKKHNCLKGYCECFILGKMCMESCLCCDCKNKVLIPIVQGKVPKIRKRIKKFSSRYKKGKKGFIRTNRKQLLLLSKGK